jgi:hypothetical protein
MDGMAVEVRYQGISVWRGARARDVGPAGAFVEMDAPLPVGTIVTLLPEDGPEIRTRVVKVAESQTGRGMQVRFAGLDEAARRFLAAGLGTAPLDAEVGTAGPAAAAPAAAAAAADEPAAESSAAEAVGDAADEGEPAPEAAKDSGDGRGKRRSRRRR